MCWKVPGLGTPDCSASHPGSTCAGRVEEGGGFSADQFGLTRPGAVAGGAGGYWARLRAKGAAATDPRVRELRAVGERAGHRAFSGGAGDAYS